MKTHPKYKITICYNLSMDLCFGGLKTHHKRTKGQGKHRQYLARIGNYEKRKSPRTGFITGFKLVMPLNGIEPSTSTLPWCCSTD